MTDRKKINPDELFLELLIGTDRAVKTYSLVVMILALGLGTPTLLQEGNWIWILNVLVFIPIPYF